MGANEKHAATYHGAEYTPRLSHVRAGYVRTTLGAVGLEEAEAQFARWLETVRAEAKAEALEEAAAAAFNDKGIQGLRRVLIGNWLRTRAAKIREGV